MKLEQRVQALEQEVALLKGQIQATLLDIQEQMLKRAYPALQADDAPASAAASNVSPVKVMTARAEPAEVTDDHFAESSTAEQVVAAPVLRQISANAPYEPEEDMDATVYSPPMPRARNGATRSLPPAAYQTPEVEKVVVEPTPANHVPSHSVPTDRDWIELEKWVAHKVEQLGVSRTQELIDFYAEQARFTEDERDMLLEFTSLYDDSLEQGNRAEHPSAARGTSAAVSKPTIVPRTREVVDEIRAELRQRESAPPAPLPQQPATDEINDSQLLVLRLIAGILNAGEDETADRQPRARNGRRRG